MDREIVDTVTRKHKERILLIEAPPRHGKSEMTSHWTPAWHTINWPRKFIIQSGYGLTLPRKFSRAVRDEIQHHGKRWGVRLKSSVRGATEWETTEGGGLLAAGIGTGITGRGADLFVIDDYYKDAQEAVSPTIGETIWNWWQTVAYPRLMPGATVIVTATRWTSNDLIGRLIEAAETGEGEPVRRLTLRALAEDDDPLGRKPGEALWPSMWNKKSLEKKRNSIDTFWWNAQHQQRPGRGLGAKWPEEYFHERLWCLSIPDNYAGSVLTLDPATGKAGKSGVDFSAMTAMFLFKHKLWVYSRLVREPIEHTISTLLDWHRRYNFDAIGVEEVAFQYLISAELERQRRQRRMLPLPFYQIASKLTKELRIQRIGPYLAGDNLRFVDDWSGRELVRQLRDFPNADYDDGPDSLEMAIHLFDRILTVEDVYDPVEAGGTIDVVGW